MSAVVQVITALERGGAQRVALEAAARLHRPHRPQFLITGRAAALDGEASERLGARLVRVRELDNPLHPSRDLAVDSEEVVHRDASSREMGGRLLRLP